MLVAPMFGGLMPILRRPMRLGTLVVVRRRAIGGGVTAWLVDREMSGACRAHGNFRRWLVRAYRAGKHDSRCRRKNHVSHSVLPAFSWAVVESSSEACLALVAGAPRSYQHRKPRRYSKVCTVDERNHRQLCVLRPLRSRSRHYTPLMKGKLFPSRIHMRL
jgi:hypothetical protein